MTEQLQTESSYLGVRFGVDNNFFPPSRSGSSGWTFNKAGRIQLALVDVTGTARR